MKPYEVAIIMLVFGAFCSAVAIFTMWAVRKFARRRK